VAATKERDQENKPVPHDDSPSGDRVLGKRYRLDEPDGSWWELGWDRPLGTYYAQQLRIDATSDEEELMAWFGCDLQEIRTPDQLSERIGRRVPETIGEQLAADATAFPLQGPPLFYLAVSTLFAGLDETPEPTGPDDVDDQGFSFDL
jgi:hypothetical protein